MKGMSGISGGGRVADTAPIGQSMGENPFAGKTGGTGTNPYASQGPGVIDRVQSGLQAGMNFQPMGGQEGYPQHQSTPGQAMGVGEMPMPQRPPTDWMAMLGKKPGVLVGDRGSY